MGIRGNGGFWNRAGRRSGGNRPAEIVVLRVTEMRFSCPSCSNDMLPMFVTSGCQDCRDIVELYHAGKLDALWDEWKQAQAAAADNARQAGGAP